MIFAEHLIDDDPHVPFALAFRLGRRLPLVGCGDGLVTRRSRTEFPIPPSYKARSYLLNSSLSAPRLEFAFGFFPFPSSFLHSHLVCTLDRAWHPITRQIHLTATVIHLIFPYDSPETDDNLVSIAHFYFVFIFMRRRWAVLRFFFHGSVGLDPFREVPLYVRISLTLLGLSCTVLSSPTFLNTPSFCPGLFSRVRCPLI
ncbi:hypothetical protein BDV23DRAFT_160342 [Aspergillus alliaceus]|uniref:Uncharacterized protein n=1 Tax=Petromyces alliaceus TaxID=209559 RepID=A0A5N7C1X0_PETAA|nr:hypothetical protein BDV23DRAFT_160342 [Aspergillus alliaceus]